MLHVTSVRVASEHSLTLQFDEGSHGEVNLAAKLTGAMFEQLRDPDQFRQAFLDPELRTVCWPNGADFTPEFLKGLA